MKKNGLAAGKLIGTYSLDVPALTQFNENEKITIFYDENKYRGHIIKSIKNKNIVLIGVRAKEGRYHSKFVIEDGYLTIRSANLSLMEAKTSLNFNLGPFEMPSKFNPTKSNLLIFDSNRFSECKNQLPLKSILQWIAISKKRNNEPVKMTVASPDFVSGKLVELFRRKLDVDSIDLYTFTNAAQSEIKNVVLKSFIPKNHFKLHGKLVYLKVGASSLLYVGSSNFTLKGFVKGNIESGVIYTEYSNDKNENRVRELLQGNWCLVPSVNCDTVDSDQDKIEPDDTIEQMNDFEDYLRKRQANDAIMVIFTGVHVSIQIKPGFKGYKFKVSGEDSFVTKITAVRWNQRLKIRVYRNDEPLAEIPIRPNSTQLIEGVIDIDSLLTVFAKNSFGNGKHGIKLEQDENSRYIKTRVAVPWHRIKKISASEFAFKNLEEILAAEDDLERKIKIINILEILRNNLKLNRLKKE